MSRRIKSLQLRLTIELTALFLLAVGGLIYSAWLTADLWPTASSDCEPRTWPVTSLKTRPGRLGSSSLRASGKPTTRRPSDRFLRSATRTGSLSRHPLPSSER
jgi:hypothetical protein